VSNRPKTPSIEVVHPRVAEMLRAKTPAQRLALAWEANRFARELIATALANQHPDWTQSEIQAEVARRMLGGAARNP
jgi:hypothetical protein